MLNKLNRGCNAGVFQNGVGQDRPLRLLTGLARAFLERNDSGRAAPLGLPVLGSEAALTRVCATVASADGSRGDARARANPRRAIAAQAVAAARATPLTARVTLPGGAHRTAVTRVPHHAEEAGVRGERAAGWITRIRASSLRSVRDEPRANERGREQTHHHFYFPHDHESLCCRYTRQRFAWCSSPASPNCYKATAPAPRTQHLSS